METRPVIVIYRSAYHSPDAPFSVFITPALPALPKTYRGLTLSATLVAVAHYYGDHAIHAVETCLLCRSSGPVATGQDGPPEGGARS
jgi:hypothetical protein